MIACPCPEEPARLEHLLVPQLSLAFVTGPWQQSHGYRTIRTESLVEKEAWQEGRSFLRLSDRVAEELLAEGWGTWLRPKPAMMSWRSCIIPM